MQETQFIVNQLMLHGLSAKQIADHCDTSVATVCRWLRGDSNATPTVNRSLESLLANTSPG